MDFTNSLNLKKEDISSISRKLEKDILSNFQIHNISYGNSIIETNFFDSLRLIYELKPSNKKEEIYKKFLIKTFIDSENLIKGSGNIAVLSFIFCSQKDLNIENCYKELRIDSSMSRRSNFSSLNSFVKEMPFKKEMQKFVLDLIEHAGFSSSCDISSTNLYEDYYKIEDACQFLVNVDSRFCSMVNKKTFEKSNCNILVVDGIVEEVSEIHHLLTYFSDNKNFCFFVCRGFSDDVINTLATNFVRGTLNVIPGILNYSIDSINTLKDISVISGFDMISTLKGDSISSIDLKELKKVDYICCNHKFLKIKNESTKTKVMQLSNNIRKHIAKEKVGDKIDLLEKRILSLNPRKMKINFSNHDKDTVGIKEDRMKNAVSLINQYCRTGEIEITKKFENEIANLVSKHLIGVGFTKFPAGPFFKGIHIGMINSDILLNTKKIINLDIKGG